MLSIVTQFPQTKCFSKADEIWFKSKQIDGYG